MGTGIWARDSYAINTLAVSQVDIHQHNVRFSFGSAQRFSGVPKVPIAVSI
jgi:hypothetical protein